MRPRAAQRPSHPTPADTDRPPGTPATHPSGHRSSAGTLARRHILKREFEVYGKAEFERRAKLSNGHLYNLRHSSRYGLRLRHLKKTRPAAVQIGERRGLLPTASPAFCASIPCPSSPAKAAPLKQFYTGPRDACRRPRTTWSS